MALSADFEKLLEHVPAAEREARRKQLAELEEGNLRQSDYSRKMNELNAAEAARKAAYDEGKKWVDENRNFYKEAITQRDAAIQKAAALEASLKPNPRDGSDISLEGIDDPAIAAELRRARVEAKTANDMVAQYGNKIETIQKMLDDGQLITAQRFEEEAGKRLNAYSAAMFDVIDKQAQARTEFGKDIDRAALLTAAQKFNGNLDAAYKEVTADLQIEKLRNEIRSEVNAEWEAKQREQGNPIASGATPVAIGPLQARVFQRPADGESTIDPSIPVDQSGRLAYAMAAELRKEGKY